MYIGKREFKNQGKTYIMGILNVTPDSFSDGGKYSSPDKALFHADEMISDGADIIDIGGESTRPGYTKISDEEEIKRIVPVIRELKKRTDVPISVDTYKAQVAKAAIEEGADLINDIWGLKYDSDMAGLIAGADVSCCIMHNADNVLSNESVVSETEEGLKESLKIAQKAGIKDDKIILDIGIGFAKDTKGNLLLLRDMAKFNELGYPMLLGASRKSVIGNTLNLPKDERDEATCALSVLAAMAGCMFVRVHNVKANKRAIDMAEAVLYV